MSFSPWLLGGMTYLWREDLWPFGDILSRKTFLAVFVCGPPLFLANFSPVRILFGKWGGMTFLVGHAIAYYYLLLLPLLIAYHRRRSRKRLGWTLAGTLGLQLVLTLILQAIVRAS